ASSRVSNSISGDVSVSVAQAQTARSDTLQSGQPRAVNVNNLQANLQVNTVQSQGSAVVVAADSGTVQQPPPSTPSTPTTPSIPTPPPTPVAVSYAGFYKTTPGSGSALGFTSTSPAFNIAYTGGQIGSDGVFTANLDGSPIRLPVKVGGGTLNFGN